MTIITELMAQIQEYDIKKSEEEEFVRKEQ